MRHWGNMGHMGHMVKKAGQFGDPEISLGWRHSGQGPAESSQTAPQKGTDSGLGRGVRHTEMGLPHNAMTRRSSLMMSAFFFSFGSLHGSRSTGSLCSCSLPLRDYGPGKPERTIMHAAPVEISPDWGHGVAWGKIRGEGC